MTCSIPHSAGQLSIRHQHSNWSTAMLSPSCCTLSDTRHPPPFPEKIAFRCREALLLFRYWYSPPEQETLIQPRTGLLQTANPHYTAAFQMYGHEQTVNDLWRVAGRLLAPCVGGVLGQDHAWTNVYIASCQSGSKSSPEQHSNTAPSSWDLEDIEFCYGHFRYTWGPICKGIT